ncbi:MAG: NAD(P)H-dependent oxidoreductase subunit E, partial [Gammaproteobacteria bacterium]
MSESRDTSQSIDEICERHNGKPGALLPILHDVQGQYGFIPRHSVAEIATNLNLTRAEVDGVVSFYSDFKTSLPARRVIKI